MKFKKIFQKAAAVVMAAVTVFSVLPATTAFAAVGDVGTISFSHTYDGNGNAMRYNSSANINGYIAGGKGNYKYRMFVDGDTAFCLQPGVPLKTGNTLKEASSEAWNALSGSQKKAVGLALLYGYQGNRGNLSGSDDEKWLATQTLVWEFVTGCREATGSYRQTSSTVYSLHFGSHYPNSGAKKVYDQIVSLMSKHNTIPSFLSGGKDDLTKELDGSFSFAKVPYGSWIIREVESPKGFVLSEEEIPVTIGNVDEVVEIELVNEFITGNIELTKVDKDYPDNKLTGAVFEVFDDTNKNGEYDKEDELLGEMSELGSGIYQMSELRYGKYFVREKTAPEGFVLDENVYTVSIEENGKTYVVENEAGKGFVNAPQSGSLKIVKTSSDGKVEGFSFRVTGANGYDQTFKTDKNGEIVIENLRIGEYTISEVSDKVSANYILPAEKQITVKVGSTTVVQMHNELRDTPKTGDDFNPFLWGGLAAVSLIGAGTFLIAGLKKKKKED